jgi:S-DNA-T family DNA segregation ATPase FtsK/SpoIIIE
MSALGVPSRLAKDIDLPNGRGLLDSSTEIQVACVADDHTGAGQAEAISAESRQLARAGGPVVPSLPELPESLVLAQPSAQKLTAPLGVADLTLDVLEVDIKRQNLVVTGPPLSGKSTALATVARGLRASSPDLRLLAIGSAASPLADLDIWDEAGFARARLTEVLRQLADDVADDESIDPRVVLFVDAAEDVDDRDVTKILEPLTKIDCLRLAVACEPTSIAKAYSGWLSALRRNRSAVMFQPESPNAVDTTIGVKPALRPAQEFPPGRAILAANRRWALIQVGEPGY